MNVGLIIKVTKAFVGVDSDPNDINKPLYQQSRFWGRIFAVGGVLAYSYYGLVLDQTLLDTVKDNIQVIANSIPALLAALSAIYGVVIKIIGQMRDTRKAKAIIASQKEMLSTQNTIINVQHQIITNPSEKKEEPIIDTSMIGLL